MDIEDEWKSSALDCYRRFYEDTGEGDGPDAILRREVESGVRFPDSLRSMLRHTTFRNSEMAHVRALSELEVTGDVLVFAAEQQACFFWGVRVADVNEPDPDVVVGFGDAWEPAGCRLDELLRFILLMNRPYEPPCLTGAYALPDPSVIERWQQVTLTTPQVTHTMWVLDDAVAEVLDGDAVIVGARTNESLSQALLALGLGRSPCLFPAGRGGSRWNCSSTRGLNCSNARLHSYALKKNLMREGAWVELDAQPKPSTP